MESKQTAVEWMFDKLLEEGSNGTLRWHLKYDIFKILEQAKEMEKQQIAEAFDKGENPFADDGKYLHGTDYYEETYKSGTE
jgi:hypothetical protein